MTRAFKPKRAFWGGAWPGLRSAWRHSLVQPSSGSGLCQEVASVNPPSYRAPWPGPDMGTVRATLLVTLRFPC